MKFGDVLCEQPFPAEGTRASSACAWPDSLSPPKSPSDSNPDRRRRSRSSPVRHSVEEAWMQAGRDCSPSSLVAETVRARTKREHVVHVAAAAALDRYALGRHYHNPSQHPRYFLSYNSGTGAGHTGFSRVSAYYSVRPPAMPLQLVPVASPTPPALPTLSCSSSPPVPTAAGANHLEQENCNSAVRNVMCDLMAALPLPVASAPAQHPAPQYPMRPAPPVPTDANVPCVPAKPVHTDNKRGGSPGLSSGESSADSEGVGSSSRVAHHVGTQAQVSRYIRSDDGHQERREGADEWLGGVRALRDSHVRLVLRQLRHIERLNRALDRATRTPPGSHSVVNAPTAPTAHIAPTRDASALLT